MSVDKSQWPARSILIARHEAGELWTTIARSLGCSRSVLRTYVMPDYRKRLMAEQPSETVQTERDRIIAMDDKFKEAMMTAIDRGKLKNIKVGIKVDRTPFTGKFMRGEPIFSGCGSSGGLCADIGEFGGRF